MQGTSSDFSGVTVQGWHLNHNVSSSQTQTSSFDAKNLPNNNRIGKVKKEV